MYTARCHHRTDRRFGVPRASLAVPRRHAQLLLVARTDDVDVRAVREIHPRRRA